MMIRTGALGLSAVLFQGMGLGLFVGWFLQTDWMFGHFKGPPMLLVLAFLSSCLGAALALAWIGLVIYRRYRELSPDRPRGRRHMWGVVRGAAMTFLLLLSALVVFLASFDLSWALNQWP